MRTCNIIIHGEMLKKYRDTGMIINICLLSEAQWSIWCLALNKLGQRNFKFRFH